MDYSFMGVPAIPFFEKLKLLNEEYSEEFSPRKSMDATRHFYTETNPNRV